MSRLRALLLLVAVATVACGKEGPPLPPLHLVPDAPSNVIARRSADQVRFTFVLPTKNVNGPGAVDLGRVEVYAATVAPGAMVPRNRDLMIAKNLVGTIEVRQPPPEGKEEQKPADARPGPGEPASFVEALDEAKLTPTYTEIEPVAPLPTTTPPVTVPVAPAPPPAPPIAKRVYGIRGISRSGRPGQPGPRIELPLGELPPAPEGIGVKFSEKALSLAWTAPTLPGAGTAQFNVYQADGLTPLNAAPLGTPSFERTGVEFGKEECFVVRTVTMAGTVSIESTASERACVTPTDIFPPAAPRGLSAVGSAGVISLIWDANTEPDVAGYLVLRGEAPGDTLQPLTPAPIKETTYRDTTVTAGVRYVYAIVAVDSAKPANTSPQSTRVEETAR